MRISAFLTQIAQDCDSRIRAVGFEDLTGVKGKPLGIIWRRKAGQYVVEIDEQRLVCPHKILWALFHELAHLKLHHIDRRYCSGNKDAQELAANLWAFEAMDITRVCQSCIDQWSPICLKEFLQNAAQ
jgi:hypothetical protein